MSRIAFRITLGIVLAGPGTALAAEGGGSMPQLDTSTFASQIFWLVILFGLLYTIMSVVVMPRLRDVHETRNRHIRSDLDHAEELKQEAEKAIKAYEKRIAEARAESERILREAVENAAERSRKKNERLAKELVAKMAEAEARIDRARTRAKKASEAETEAQVLVQGLTAALIGKRPQAAEAASAVAAAEASVR